MLQRILTKDPPVVSIEVSSGTLKMCSPLHKWLSVLTEESSGANKPIVPTEGKLRLPFTLP